MKRSLASKILELLCYLGLAAIFAYFSLQIVKNVAANTAIEIMNDPPMYKPWLDNGIEYDI